METRTKIQRTLQKYFLLLSILSFSVFTITCTSEQSIIIGFSGPLQGKYSDLGVQGRNGAQFAVEEINADGGIAGRMLKMISEDDSGESQTPVQADLKLIEAGAVAIIGHMTSSRTIAALPQAEKKGIILVSPTTSTPKLSGKNDNFFRLVSTSADHAKAIAEYGVKRLNIKNTVIMGDIDNRAYVVPFVDAFTEQFSALSGTILSNIEFSSRSLKTTESIVGNLSLKGLESILIVASAQDSAKLIQEIRRINPRVQIFIAPWAYTKELVELGGPSVNGVITAMDYSDDIATPKFLSFKNRFKNRFGQDPNFAAFFAYEAVLTLTKALETTEGRTEGLKEALREINNLDGVIGKISLDSYGDVNRPYFILTIKNSALVSVHGDSG